MDFVFNGSVYYGIVYIGSVFMDSVSMGYMGYIWAPYQWAWYLWPPYIWDRYLWAPNMWAWCHWAPCILNHMPDTVQQVKRKTYIWHCTVHNTLPYLISCSCSSESGRLLADVRSAYLQHSGLILLVISKML